MFWENFLALCEGVNKKPNKVAAELGCSSGSVTAWKNGRIPKWGTLLKIAKYFGVAPETLIGNSDKSYSINASGIAEDKIENHLHSSYNELTVANKEKVDDYIKKLLLEQQNEEPQEITITYAAKGQGSKTIQKAVSPETIDIIKRIMSEE